MSSVDNWQASRRHYLYQEELLLLHYLCRSPENICIHTWYIGQPQIFMDSSATSPLSAASPFQRPQTRSALGQTIAYPSPARSESDRPSSAPDGLGLYNVVVPFSSVEAYSDITLCPPSSKPLEPWTYPLASSTVSSFPDSQVDPWYAAFNTSAPMSQSPLTWNSASYWATADSFDSRLSPAPSDCLLVSESQIPSTHESSIYSQNGSDPTIPKAEQQPCQEWLSNDSSSHGVLGFQDTTICPEHLSSTLIAPSFRSHHTPVSPAPNHGIDKTPEYGLDHSISTPRTTKRSSRETEAVTTKDIKRVRSVRRPTTQENANYECHICHKLFQRSYNHRSHMEVHNPTREYPNPCEYKGCTKKFVRKTCLLRHEQSVRDIVSKPLGSCSDRRYRCTSNHETGDAPSVTPALRAKIH